MKKTVIILSIIAVSLAILFGISVGLTGFTMPFNIGFGSGRISGEPQTYDYNFAESFDNIKLEMVYADTTIISSNSQSTEVKYKTNLLNPKFTANVENNTLVIKEDLHFFNLFSFSFGGHETTLEVQLPQKIYNNVIINSTSGDYEINRLESVNFKSHTTSGDFNMNLFAENIDMYSTSGDIVVTNCTDKIVNTLKSDKTSGDTEINGFKTNSFELYSTSGNYNVIGISGRGKIDLTSGDVNVSYAEWNNDLSIHTLSGGVDIQLPLGSGVNVNFTGASGNVKSELENNKTNLSRGSTATIGGSNVHSANIDLTSGDVKFFN